LRYTIMHEALQKELVHHIDLNLPIAFHPRSKRGVMNKINNIGKMPTKSPSDFPRRPRLPQGRPGQGGVDSLYRELSPAGLIVFIHSEQDQRTHATRASPQRSPPAPEAREEVMREMGPPVETITLSDELDATYQLELPMRTHYSRARPSPALATL
jgi:hypothetical protein